MNQYAELVMCFDFVIIQQMLKNIKKEKKKKTKKFLFYNILFNFVSIKTNKIYLLTIKNFSKMKKFYAFFIAVALVSFVACGPKAEETTEEVVVEETPVVDTTAVIDTTVVAQ